MKIEYHPDFSDDLSEAAFYLEKKESGLGTRFIDTVEEACIHVRKNPAHHSYIDKPVRRILAHPFSFAIHFEIVGPDEIFFYGVFHCARDPQRWQDRYASKPD